MKIESVNKLWLKEIYQTNKLEDNEKHEPLESISRGIDGKSRNNHKIRTSSYYGIIGRGMPVPLLYNDYGLEFEPVVYNPSSSNSKSIQNKMYNIIKEIYDDINPILPSFLEGEVIGNITNLLKYNSVYMKIRYGRTLDLLNHELIAYLYNQQK